MQNRQMQDKIRSFFSVKQSVKGKDLALFKLSVTFNRVVWNIDKLFFLTPGTDAFW